MARRAGDNAETEKVTVEDVNNAIVELFSSLPILGLTAATRAEKLMMCALMIECK